MEHLPGDLSTFSANLRTLCDRHGSVSAVCRRIGVNRQQFNKYLSGHHAPSPRNARKIANFFGLSLPILFSSPEEFRTLIEGNFFYAMDNLRSSPQFRRFLELTTTAETAEYAEFAGVYDRYQFSSIYTGHILRSAFCIYPNGQFMQHYYVERFPSYDVPGKAEYIFKYHGFTFPIADRFFCFDFESVQMNEMTFSNFAPVHRSSTRFMYGVTSGIAATMYRQPFATKVALHYRSPGLIRRDHLRDLTVLEPNDPSIPREVSFFLGNGGDMIRVA